jgi:putative FmdB family regulatory protein
MPFFDYKCTKCGKVNTIFKKSAFEREGFFTRRKKYRCESCGSPKLKRLYSSFSVAKKESTADTLNDLSKMAPINFVPDYRPKGPPPGGCPYAHHNGANRES